MTNHFYGEIDIVFALGTCGTCTLNGICTDYVYSYEYMYIYIRI